MNRSTHSRLAALVLITVLVLPASAAGQVVRGSLAIDWVDATDGNYKPGDQILVSAEVRVSAGGNPVDIDLWIFASRDQIAGPDDVVLLKSNINHSGSHFSRRAAFPREMPAGKFYIGARIQSRQIADTNVTDNWKVDPNPISVTTKPAADEFRINEGLSDAWYDPERPGQGFFITVYPDIQKVFLGWFTFDSSASEGSDATALLGYPTHRWLTALGPYTGDMATLNVELTQGGIFNTTPPETTQSSYGTISLTFANCNEAELTYKLISGPSSVFPRTVALQRTHASPDTLALCEALEKP